MNKVLISADSTCDIGPELQKKFNIRLLNWRIELDGQEYIDNQEITILKNLKEQENDVQRKVSGRRNPV